MQLTFQDRSEQSRSGLIIGICSLSLRVVSLHLTSTGTAQERPNSDLIPDTSSALKMSCSFPSGKMNT
jgi:hypothetical protein